MMEKLRQFMDSSVLLWAEIHASLIEAEVSGSHEPAVNNKRLNKNPGGFDTALG
jgi:hypothetical protein